MAETIAAGPESGGLTHRLSLADTNAVQVNFPAWVRKVTVQFLDSGGSATEGKVLRGQTQSDGAAMSSHAFPVPAGVGWELVLSPGISRQLSGCSIYVSGPASGFAHLDMEL